MWCEDDAPMITIGGVVVPVMSLCALAPAVEELTQLMVCCRATLDVSEMSKKAKSTKKAAGTYVDLVPGQIKSCYECFPQRVDLVLNTSADDALSDFGKGIHDAKEILKKEPQLEAAIIRIGYLDRFLTIIVL